MPPRVRVRTHSAELFLWDLVEREEYRGGFIGLILVDLPFGVISPQSVVIFTVGEESSMFYVPKNARNRAEIAINTHIVYILRTMYSLYS